MLIQLNLEEKNSQSQLPKQARSQLINFLSQLNLPISIESICLKNMSSIELQKACKFACEKNSDIHRLPFEVNENDLLEAIQKFQSLPFNSQISINKT